MQGEYDLQVRSAALSQTKNWLPASEIRGEGILIVLGEAAVSAWEHRPAVQQRGLELRAGYDEWVRTVPGAAPFPGVRFYLLHSLAHLLMSAIAERTTRPVPRLELVWTGPEARVSTARDTAVVVRQLFARAERTVLVAGFSFKGGHDIFEPLHVAMRDRGVEARVFLHIDDRPGLTPEQSVLAGVDQFLHENWPFGAPVPHLFYDPRTVAPGSSINLHAKCIVVDERLTFVGSANFTHNAHARNIEVGILVEDSSLATELGRQWQGLYNAGLVSEAVLEGSPT